MRAGRAAVAACSLVVAAGLAGLPAAGALAQERITPPHNVPGESLGFPGGIDPGALRADQRRGTPMRVWLTPSPARLGQPMIYRGVVLAPGYRKVRFEPPKTAGAFTWSNVRAGRVKPNQILHGPVEDSVWIEARLQVFETGPIVVPGPVVQLDPAPNSRVAGSSRLPSVRVMILPTITAADSGAELRALHGPLGAPWWERVAWTPIVLTLLLILVIVLLVRALRRRPKLVQRAAPVASTARPRLDPAAEALRALAALRARGLPAAARYGEHALELTAILRRFLETTIGTPRPGDTSGEVLERLRAAHLADDDVQRLEGLLGLWDRVKFAREPLTEREAERCEEAVEGYVRAVSQARLDAAATAARASARATGRGAGEGSLPPPPPTTPASPTTPEAA